MKVNLHIETLVLDGLPLTRREGPLVQRAIELELAKLIADGNFVSAGSNALATARAPAITLASTSPQGMGRQIAGSVFEGIRR